MVENGYQVQEKDVNNLPDVKAQYQVPLDLQGCHTAIVDGYVVEGHVPVAEVEKLLVEKPDIIGLAVPGMPMGTPGMEGSGFAPQPFDVIAFDEAGTRTVFASYPDGMK